MAFLLNLVPFWYRWAAIGLLVVAVWGHGYVKGRAAADDAKEAVIAKIQSERDQQALKTAEKIIKDKGAIADVVQDFHSNIAAINAYWVRQPKTPASLPANPTPPEGTPAGQPNPVFDRSYEELEQTCAITTVMFNACREGWMRQE